MVEPTVDVVRSPVAAHGLDAPLRLCWNRPLATDPGGTMADVVVRVDPRFAPEYASYYLRGLVEHAEACSLRVLPFTREGFPVSYVDEQPLAFTLQRGARMANIYISAKDGADVDEAVLEWADVYGKVNLLRGLVPAGAEDKVVPIGPSHGIRIWGLVDSVRAARATLRAGADVYNVRRRHYRRYLALYRDRETDDLFEPGTSEDRYVFYNATLWPARHAEVNPPRAEFLRACQDLVPRIEVEGGFIPPKHLETNGYGDLVADRHYGLVEYLDRIKRSAVVFNNPAAHGCLGWKLAEFLRLGKAIISLPLSRELPEPLVHGQHIHIVDGSRESLREAILRLVEDRVYRARLEHAARRYYLDHLTAAGVIRRLADAAFSQRDVATDR